MSGLLQFATHLVFSDQIFVSAFEGAEVRAYSDRVVDEISTLGAQGIVGYLDIPHAIFENICHSAANKLAEELEFLSRDTHSPTELVATSPELGNEPHRHDAAIHGLLTSPDREKRRDQIVREAFHATREGSAIYMLCCSDPLWQNVLQLVDRPTWTVEDTAGLGVLLRTTLNSELAEQKKAPYCPAPARARIVRSQGEFLLEKVETVVAGAARELGTVSLKLPSVAFALCKIGRSDPRGILGESIGLRERATDLRDYLGGLQKHDGLSDPVRLHQVALEFDELLQVVRVDLGLEECPSLYDALRLQFVGYFPLPDAAKLREWYKHRKHHRKVTLLSEFANFAANERVDPNAYEKLLRNAERACTSHSR